MSSKMNGKPDRTSTLNLRQRLLGVGVLGGVLTGVAAVIAMSTAVGGVALIANTATTTAPAPKVAAAPKAATPVAALAPTKAVTKQVMIENFVYSPAALTIAVGDTVTWTNMDEAPHTVTVTSGPEKFASPTLQKGETFTHTFTKAGTYQYYCAVHPDMKASVTATGGGGTPTTPTPTPTTPSMPGHGGTPTEEACAGAMSAADAFLQHFYAGHLETSVGQQVKEITDVDQYVKTHTVLVENMLKPLLSGSDSALQKFLQHFYSAHLETSLGQQVKEITDADQYVKTHTVLVEDMVKSLLGGDADC